MITVDYEGMGTVVDYVIKISTFALKNNTKRKFYLNFIQFHSDLSDSNTI